MSDLSGFGDESFDLVIANGVLMFAKSTDELRATFNEASRVLGADGHLVIYHRNRWRVDEPEHGGRPLQLAPRFLQHRLAAEEKEPKRWASPLELRRLLRRAGFADVRIAGWVDGRRLTRGPRRLAGESYAVTARRPPR